MNLRAQGFIKCIATVRSNITILSSKIGVISNGIKTQVAPRMKTAIKVKIGSVV